MEHWTCPLVKDDAEDNGHGKPAHSPPVGQKISPRRALILPTAVFALLIAIFFSSPLEARQDNARLSFQKIAGKSSKNIHIVKKGESLLSILSSMPGKKPVSLSIIRRLNPGLRNLNRIYPGQKIVLPSPEPDDQLLTNIPPEKQADKKPTAYLLKENDSISNIILSELKVKPEEAIRAYRQIRALNPDIEDMNNLPAGRLLLLPGNSKMAAVIGYEQPAQEDLPEKKTFSKDVLKTHPALNALLAVISPVIERMGGTINAAGTYFIPLPGNSQISIDCSIIPAVELDDGTTTFLDYEGRLDDNFKQLIRQSWGNYYFLASPGLQSVTSTLQGIIIHAHNYRMTRVEKPLILKEKPEITVFPDWIITGNKKTEGLSYRQGIFLLSPGETPLPAAARLLLEQSGFAVTQISKEGESSYHKEKHELFQIAQEDLRGIKGIAFAERLLTALGEKPLRQTPVAIFRQDANGFNLSITADLLLRKGERKLILHSKKLPDQFIKILNNSGFEFVMIGENDNRKSLVENILSGAGLPVSFGYFSYRIPEEGKNSRIEISFSALSSANEDKQIHLVDFYMPAVILPVIYNHKKIIVINY